METILALAALFLAIILHEVAHGYVAYLLGDDTAKRYGRLSLNPIKHVDTIGTIVVPALLYFSNAGFVFGWAKPVPVNYYNLKNTKRDIFLVSSAGIVTNLVLAFLSAFIIKIFIPFAGSISGDIILTFLTAFIIYNIILAVFNLIPIPPLDGSKMLFSWIEKPWAKKYLENDRLGFGIIILIGIILPMLFPNIDIFRIYIKETTTFILGLLP